MVHLCIVGLNQKLYSFDSVIQSTYIQVEPPYDTNTLDAAKQTKFCSIKIVIDYKMTGYITWSSLHHFSRQNEKVIW